MENITPDTRLGDHLNPKHDFKFDTSGYTDVVAPSKDREEEFLAQGYTVLTRSEDLILVGKKIVEAPKEEVEDETVPTTDA